MTSTRHLHTALSLTVASPPDAVIAITHDTLPPTVNNELMQDRRFANVSDRDKVSIKDAILGDLQLQFEQTNLEHLSRALQIMLLRNKKLHGYLEFTDAPNPQNSNPFVIQLFGHRPGNESPGSVKGDKLPLDNPP